MKFDLNEAIHNAINDYPTADAYHLADIISASVPPAQVRRVLTEILPSYLGPRLRDPNVAVTHLGTYARSSKLAARKILIETGTWTITLPHSMGGGQAQLKDLTADMCEELAKLYELKSMEAGENARRLKTLARAIRESKVETVEELGKKRILMILGVDDETGLTMLPVSGMV